METPYRPRAMAPPGIFSIVSGYRHLSPGGRQLQGTGRTEPRGRLFQADHGRLATRRAAALRLPLRRGSIYMGGGGRGTATAKISAGFRRLWKFTDSLSQCRGIS